jgi:hypothetical protein
MKAPDKKFIVINYKHLSELLESNHLIPLVKNLKNALEAIDFALPQNEYYVVNQDEPFAPIVWDLICGKKYFSHDKVVKIIKNIKWIEPTELKRVLQKLGSAK